MSDQTARGPAFGGASFPTPCARCGGRLSGPVSFCPHCGAPARLAFGSPSEQNAAKSPPRAPGATAARAGASLAEMLWPSRPTPLFASADSDPYGDMRAPSTEGASSSTRWNVDRWAIKKGTALTLLAFFALYGGTILLHRYDDTQATEQQRTSVQGSVTTGGTGEAAESPTASRRSAIASDGRTMRDAAAVRGAAPIQSPATAQTTAQTSPNAVRETRRERQPAASLAMSQATPPSGIVAQSAETPPSLSKRGGSPASGKQYSAKNQRLMSLALARAQNGFEKNDLRMARSGVYWALSLQPDNSEALTLKQQLLARERGHVAASKGVDSSDE